jgi:hypothetical protein
VWESSLSNDIVDSVRQLEAALTAHSIALSEVFVGVPLKEWNHLKRVVSHAAVEVPRAGDEMCMQIGGIRIVPHDEGWPVD